MIRMDIAAVAEVLGDPGGLLPRSAVPVTGAVADSRAAGPGDLYVAILGERVNGHDFSDAAHAAGAVVTLGSRPTGQPTIVVPGDPIDALGRLASHTLDRLPAARVAITGSSGKTTTKDLIATLLEDVGPTVAPSGSFNTEVGLPLTILRATEDTRLVLEMGARGIGHVGALCRIAPPDVSVGLRVGPSRRVRQPRGDRAGQGWIVEALPRRAGRADADDPIVAGDGWQTLRAPLVTIGPPPTRDVRLPWVSSFDPRPGHVRAARASGAPRCRWPWSAAYGRQRVRAAAVVLRWGLSIAARAAKLLATPAPRRPSRWRSRRPRAGDHAWSTTRSTPVPSPWGSPRSLAAMRKDRPHHRGPRRMRELAPTASPSTTDSRPRRPARHHRHHRGRAGRPRVYLGAAPGGLLLERGAVSVADVTAAIAQLRGRSDPVSVVPGQGLPVAVGLEAVARTSWRPHMILIVLSG